MFFGSIEPRPLIPTQVNGMQIMGPATTWIGTDHKQPFHHHAMGSCQQLAPFYVI